MVRAGGILDTGNLMHAVSVPVLGMHTRHLFVLFPKKVLGLTVGNIEWLVVITAA